MKIGGKVGGGQYTSFLKQLAEAHLGPTLSASFPTEDALVLSDSPKLLF